MAAGSPQSSPYVAPMMSESSPQLRGLKKVLSGRRRSSEQAPDEIIRDLRTESLDSLAIEKSPTRQSTRSTRSVSQDGSSRSGSSGVRKLLPGHSKRRRRRMREEELKIAAEEHARGRNGNGSGSGLSLPATTTTTPPASNSRRPSSLLPLEPDTSLLTDDSEIETPPLLSRDSHNGYLTMSSPLVSAVTTHSDDEAAQKPAAAASMASIPALMEPKRAETSPSPRSPPLTASGSASPTLGLAGRSDTLRPKSRTNSISKLRGISPARRFKDVFGKPSKSPKVSPERGSSDSTVRRTDAPSSPTVVANAAITEEPKPALPRPATLAEPPLNRSMPNLDVTVRPSTPPTTLMTAPLTTVTPPTPTESRFDTKPASPQREKSISTPIEADSGIVVSPSGNMISHRKTRSAGSITHQPSKLSSSVTAPLTPTSEESRSPSGGGVFGARTASGGIFSSWVSAAQNAATTTITNLTGQNRARSGTNASDSSNKPKVVEAPIKEEEEPAEPDSPKKQLAVETMGSGDLNFEHLGLTAEERVGLTLKPNLTELRKDSTLERDEAAAKAEDILAKRAVSAAYERMSETNTPVAELPDPLDAVRPAPAVNGSISGERTTPNGSVFESEVGSIRRTNSVRSKMTRRRSRGSSAATGHSAIGAMIGASTAALANPARAPRPTGFTLAPKQRNRNFHQQFRSVPEDDYLIEDYSCALQKEILLAGRIYISEGHICFFSNILGWVTTVVISFEEVVSIERENTAVVFPNAIAIQTLHARHTFRSLIYREQTYDLLIGIWRVSHPASFQKSINGKQLAAEEAIDATSAVVENGASGQPSDGSITDDSGSGEDDGSEPSLVESSASHPGSEGVEGKTLSRKQSGMNAPAVAQTASIMAGTANDVPLTLAAQAGISTMLKDFPGPASHAPTDCTDSTAHYEKIIKDDIIAAPLGKIYSLLYGPESGFFIRKFLADECKCTEIVLDDDKKGLGSEAKSRQYTYIKPLGSSIGPKQTKCITTENLDFFDLEKAVSITCTTQSPDVPSGNAFSVKTRYCLSWAPGNATRLQMNCTIEWSAKSWLKGPIEKGANDGQQQYGDSLVKVLKSAVNGRPRGTTNASKVSKTAKKKRKGEKKAKEEQIVSGHQPEDWGLLEPLRGPLQPITSILRPALKLEVLVGILTMMVFWLWLRSPSTTVQLGPHAGFGFGHPQRLAAYNTLWAREENELWDWLEARAGVDTLLLREKSNPRSGLGSVESAADVVKQRMKQHQRAKAFKSATRDVEATMRQEKISRRSMEKAVQMTRERLEILESVLQRDKQTQNRDDAHEEST